MLTRLAVLALGLTLVTAGPAAATPYDEMPVGAPTTVPWWQHGRLHIGDIVIETRHNDIASRGGTTVVGPDVDRRMGRPTTWSIVTGDRLTPLPRKAKADQPLVSADGHWVAWLEVTAPSTDKYRRTERYRVVLYDAQTGDVAKAFRDKRRVAWEDGINGIWLRTLSNDGQLVLSQGRDGLKVLTAAGRVPFAGPRVNDGVQLDGWPLGTTVFQSRSHTSVYGSIDESGAFERAGSFGGSFAGTWSPDGGAYVSEDDDDAFSVRTLDGAIVPLQVPDDLDALRVVGWESDDAVVLWSYEDWTDDVTSRLIRCSAGTGACEAVPGGPGDGARATMPSPY